MDEKTNGLPGQRKSVIWALGSSSFTETPKTSLTRLKCSAAVTLISSKYINHPHFVQIAIPTPAILDSRNFDLVKAWLRFRTGNRAQTTEIRLYDAELQFKVIFGPLKTRVFKDFAFIIDQPHRITHAISFAIQVTFLWYGSKLG